MQAVRTEASPTMRSDIVDDPAVGRSPAQPKARLALVACILSSSLVGIDGVMTPVALPAVAEDLGVGLVVQQWVVAAYLLALGSLMLVGGALGDAFDRWRVFAGGTAAYGVAAMVTALAPTSAVLIGGRFLQGAAAALTVPAALSVITTTFAGADRSKAIGTWTAWSGVSMIVGPGVGGLLVEAFSWRAIYGVLGPLSLVVVCMIVRAAPAGARPATTGPVDRLGAVLAVPIVGGPVFALIQAPEIGWASPPVVAALSGGVAAAAAFVSWERRAPNPLVPFAVFRSRAFTNLNVVTFLLYAGFIGGGVYVVLFLQQTAGYAPAAAGLASVLPMVVLFFLARPLGAVADRYDSPRPFITGGALLVLVSMAFLLRTDADADLWTVVLPWGLVHGLGLALVVAPLTEAVVGAVDEGHAGIASGINNAVARVGSLFGIAVVGLLIASQFSAGVTDRVAQTDLSAETRAALRTAADSPLTTKLDADADVDPGDRRLVEQAMTGASVDAFRLGIGGVGVILLLGTLLTVVGFDIRRGL